MDEGQIKAATLMHVREATGRGRKPIITAEFTLGDSGVRADLAVFGNETIGIEIKTAKDTLRRLSAQMEAYATHFTHAIAIVAPCHLANLTADQLHGGSLWTYDDEGRFTQLHVGKTNLVSDTVLRAVLTQAERRKFDFLGAMAARYGKTSKRFWSAVARRSIRPDDLPLLSRFSESREQARRLAAEREQRWAHWLAAQDGPALASA